MQKKYFFSTVFFIFFFLQNSQSEIISGLPVVTDGDTIKINNNKIRLFGIDAPEKKQLCEKIFLTISFISLKKKISVWRNLNRKIKKTNK